MNVQNNNCFPKPGLISLYKFTEKMRVRWRAAVITLKEVRARVMAWPQHLNQVPRLSQAPTSAASNAGKSKDDPSLTSITPVPPKSHPAP